MTQPLSHIVRTGLLLAALLATSLLIDWRIVSIAAGLLLAGFAVRSVRRHLLAGDERLVGRLGDVLATGWVGAGVMLLAGLPSIALVTVAAVGISYLALASITAHLLIAGVAGFIAGRDAGLVLLRSFDAVREAWLPRPRRLACSLALVSACIETLALSVVLFALLQLGPAESMASALLLRTASVAASWAWQARAASAGAEVIDLPRAPYEPADRDIAA